MPTMRSDVQTEKSRKYHKTIKKIEKQKQEKLKKKDISSETTRRFSLFSFPFILTLFLLPFIFILFSLFVAYHRHILVLFLRRQH